MKKVLIFISLFLVLFVTKVDAITINTSYNACVREESNHYGVNKKWSVTDRNMDNVLSTPCVDPSLKIYDYANILTEGEEKALKQKIYAYNAKYDSEIIIITIDSSFYDEYEVESFVADFYDYNDFGINFEKYSGTVLLRNIDRVDRYFNIYTFGEAQLYFSGSRTENILDSIYNDLYNGNYLQGFGLYIDMITDYHEKGIPRENRFDTLDEYGNYTEGFNPPIFMCSVIASLFTFFIILSQVRSHKMIRKSLKADDYLDLTSIKYTTRENKFTHSITTTKVVPRSGEFSSGGSGSGHSSSSGGHSIGSSGGGHSSGMGRRG